MQPRLLSTRCSRLVLPLLLSVACEDASMAPSREPSSLRPGSVSQVVGNLWPAYRQCYNAGLASDPTTKGKVALTIHVGAEGQVVRVVTKKRGNLSRTVVDCIAEHTQRARFTPPQGRSSIVIRVPVSLTPLVPKTTTARPRPRRSN